MSQTTVLSIASEHAVFFQKRKSLLRAFHSITEVLLVALNLKLTAVLNRFDQLYYMAIQ